MHRYTAGSQRMRELRHESVKILFHGEDEVSLQKDDVMFEALGTSSTDASSKFRSIKLLSIIMLLFWHLLY